jgi:hypothetical protein
MRILYANVIEQNAQWGAEVFVNRALRELGHATTCIDFRKHRDRLARRFLEAPPFDAFLLQRGDRFPLGLVRAVRRPRVFWASELLSRCRDQDPLIKSGLFDHVYFHSQACVRTAVARGWMPADRCAVMLNGFDPQLYRRIDGVEQDLDVLFVGLVTGHRAPLLERLGRVCRLHVAQAYGEDCVRLMNRARIVLNIHAGDFPDTETRVFEAMGSGGFLLSERLSEDSPFRDGEHLVECDDEAGLVEKIGYYLAHDEERRAIAERGHAVALTDHTYLARARQIAAVLERCIAERGPEALVGPSVDAVRLRAAEILEWPHRLLTRWRRHRCAV